MSVFDPHIIHPFPPNHLGHGGLNREDDTRSQPNLVKTLLQGEDTRIVFIWRSANFFTTSPSEPEQPKMGWLTVKQAEKWLERAKFLIYLGKDETNNSYIAADISAVDEVDLELLKPFGYFADLRETSPLISGTDGSILAYARALCFWHHRHLFCGVCGSPTQIENAGHVRKCASENCNIPHFPRTDAAIIVNVTFEDKILLGRQPVWPEGMLSVLAGFIEPGESLEHAVAREVYEEAGVKIKNIRYQHSQPWPFPASLMLGFEAEAIDDTLNVNFDEIEHAGWYSREDIDNFDAKGLYLPRKLSIARRLIDEWL